jgi:predicted dehydrogenase
MKRRDFVIKTGLVSAGIAATSTMGANIIGSMKANDTLNIGIIGTGDRGGGMTPVINGIDKFNVVACSDLIPYRLDACIAKTDGKAKAYVDYRRLLDDKNVDAVLIATPLSTHSAIAIDALDAGKHIYCEKTMAKGYKGIKKMVDKARNSKTIFQTGHQYHSSRLYSHIVDLIHSGKIGKISSFECQWNRNGDWRRPVPQPELERAINWRMYREYSGGLTAELSSHQIDFVNWVLGAVPDKVVGVGGIDYWKDGRETFDNTHLIYTYAGGEKAKFTCLTSNAKDDYQIKVFGDKGTIIIDYTQAWFYPEGKIKKKMGNVDGVTSATAKFDPAKGYPIKVQHADPSKQALIDFRESVVNNKKPISDIITGGETAVCVQMGLDAMYEEKIVKWKSGVVS